MSDGRPLRVQIEKMGKSKLNVVSPDVVIDRYGADTTRLHVLFMGPLEQVKLWQMDGVEGVLRFLHRVWRLVVDQGDGDLSPRIVDRPGPSEATLWRALHQTVKKVTEDTANLRFNTAISQMMIFVNEAMKAERLPHETLSPFLRVLSPYAPHLAEELWSRLGNEGLVCQADWPAWDEDLCRDETIRIVIQVNGKRRDELVVEPDMDREDLERLVLESERVRRHLAGREPRKFIVVPNRLVNVVG